MSATTDPVTVQLSDSKGFKLQPEYADFFDKHPDVKKSFLEGDKTIAELSNTTKELQRWKQENEPKLTKENERSTPEWPEFIDDPKKFGESLLLEAENRSVERANQISERNNTHTVEVQKAADLVSQYFSDEIETIEDPQKRTEFYSEKLKALADRAHELGGYEEDKGKIFYRKGSLEAAFSTRFMGELLAKAEKRGSGKMSEEINKSQQSYGTIPAGERTKEGGNTDQRLQSDRQNVLEDAFKGASENIQKLRSKK